MAGISLNAIVGDNGIINKAQKAKDETSRADVKEKLEMKVLNAQIEKSKNGEQLTREDVINEIKNLQNITYDDLGKTIEGECEKYLYTIDENFNVIVGQKVSGEDIKGEANVIDRGDFAETVEIQVIGTLEGGSITSIESLSDGAKLTADKSNNEKRFTVEDNGTYIFRITGSNGRRIKVMCIVTNAIPIKQDLLTAVKDLEQEGISKCKILGKPRRKCRNRA